MGWIITFFYIVGFAITFRRFVLSMTEASERAKDIDMEGVDYLFAAVGALVWPIIWIVMGFWKIIFPKGVRTKYAKEKAREAKFKEAEAALKKSQEEIRRLSEELGLKVPEGM